MPQSAELLQSPALNKPSENGTESNRPRTIAAGEFKAKCLRLMDEIAETREEIIITKFGKPVARLGPVETKRTQLRGTMRGSVLREADTVSPLGQDSWGWFAEP